MDLSYWLYMNEAEGVDTIVSTRQAKINAIGRELREAGYSGKVVPTPIFLSYCNKHGIKSFSTKFQLIIARLNT